MLGFLFACLLFCRPPYVEAASLYLALVLDALRMNRCSRPLEKPIQEVISYMLLTLDPK